MVTEHIITIRSEDLTDFVEKQLKRKGHDWKDWYIDDLYAVLDPKDSTIGMRVYIHEPIPEAV